MCTEGCIEFVERRLLSSDVKGRTVLEVGSFDVNGTVRRIVQAHQPVKYIGVDLSRGPGVDEICAAEELVQRYGSGAFDVVVSTEMIEHVRDWRAVVHNLKEVLSETGVLVITTRSPGCPFHGYPYDYWRYTEDDFRLIFSDMTIEALEADAPNKHGIFLLARKPRGYEENRLDGHRLYSIIRRRRAMDATTLDSAASRSLTAARSIAAQVLPAHIKQRIHRFFGRET